MKAGFQPGGVCGRLLDLGFLVEDVLADDRIEFPDLHLASLVTLVLGRGIEKAGAGGGHQGNR